MEIPCGQCAECQQTLSNQWFYRAWYEWHDVCNAGGYCYFDCLTYSSANLPKLSDMWTYLEPKDDYPCFNPVHLKKFLDALFKRVERAGYGKCLRYFLCSEYGTRPRDGVTYRPHYHIMLYVSNPDLPPIYLSEQLSDIWKYGRTDGAPYKANKYVMTHNVIGYDSPLGRKLVTCHYVTKYVQKSCAFQSELNSRLDKVMWRLAEFVNPAVPSKWLESEEAHRERLKLSRYVNQFHRQSQHFGESALGDLDLNQVFEDGCIYMPDTKGVKIPIPLSTYYKRKLFQEQIMFNGSRYWQLTDLGRQYRDYRKTFTFENLVDRYRALVIQYQLPIKDVRALADYVFNKRGRIIADLPESTIEERCDKIDFINYSNPSDKMNFGHRGLTTDWLGDSQQGYDGHSMGRYIKVSSFIKNYCYIDEHFEKELEMIKDKMQPLNKACQEAHALKQRLTNIYKGIT